MSERVSIRIEQQIAHVSLNRADKHNALDMEMFRAIVGAQKTVKRESSLRAVILSGQGVDFCTGIDVKSLMSNRSASIKLLWKWLPWQSNLAQKVSTGWRNLPVPVIAALQGRCWGGGMQIALGADFRIAHPDASLSIMEGRWGLIPDMGGSLAVRDLMAPDHAMKLTMTAAEVDAEYAARHGLVTEISDAPLERAEAFARELKERSPDAIRATKKLIYRGWHGGTGSALARETLYQIGVISKPNQRIAVKRQMGKDIPYR